MPCFDCTSAVNAHNTSVAIINSTFFDPAPFNGSSYIRAWGGARVLLSGCEFAPTPHHNKTPFYVRDNGTIYSDVPLVVRSDPGVVPFTAAPASSAPAAFPTRNDPWFASVRLVLPLPLPPCRTRTRAQPLCRSGPAAAPLAASHHHIAPRTPPCECQPPGRQPSVSHP